MPTKLELTSLRESLTGWLSRKTQVLKGMVSTKGLFGHQFEEGSPVSILVKKLSIFKKYLSVAITILIIVVGLALGKRIASFSSEVVSIPKPASLPTTTTLSKDSRLSPLRQSIIQFDSQLPGLLLPEFNDSISIQELED